MPREVAKEKEKEDEGRLKRGEKRSQRDTLGERERERNLHASIECLHFSWEGKGRRQRRTCSGLLHLSSFLLSDLRSSCSLLPSFSLLSAELLKIARELASASKHHRAHPPFLPAPRLLLNLSCLPPRLFSSSFLAVFFLLSLLRLPVRRTLEERDTSPLCRLPSQQGSRTEWRRHFLLLSLSQRSLLSFDISYPVLFSSSSRRGFFRLFRRRGRVAGLKDN